MKKFLKLLSPTGLEIVVYLSISLIILIVSQFTNLLTVLGQDTDQAGSGQAIFSAFGDQFSQFVEAMSDINIAAPIILALFWSAVGVILYLVVNIFRNFWLDTENDLLVEAAYVHPKNYTHRSFWFHFIARIFMRVSALILIGVYSLMAIQVLLPLWMQLVETWTEGPGDIVALLNALLAVPGMMLTLHIFVLLSRLLFLRQRIFGDYS